MCKTIFFTSRNAARTFAEKGRNKGLQREFKDYGKDSAKRWAVIVGGNDILKLENNLDQYLAKLNKRCKR